MALGIDVGGTKILAVVVVDGEIVKKWKYKTQNGKVLNDIRKIIIESGEKKVGIGVPCYLRDGICIHSPHIEELSQKNLNYLFPDAKILNDGTAMAYGEYYLRNEKYDPLLLVALGTGVGSGLVVNHRPYIGRGSAMEIGHLKGFSNKICKCGKRGCFETLIGGDYIKNIKEIHEFAIEGDYKSVQFFKNYGKNLAMGLSYAIQLLDPEIVVIGGSISKAFEFFIEPMKKELNRLLSFVSGDDIIFEKVRKENSGALGAALIAEKNVI